MKDNNFILLDDDDNEDSKNGKMKQGSGDSSASSRSLGPKLEDIIKLNVFNIFCSLLKTGLEITPWKIYLLLAIEFVQLHQFSLHPSVSLNYSYLMAVAD